jgi:ribonuclease J
MSTEARGGLRICPLGGLGEVGMNCLALEQRGCVLLVDCGVTFDRRGLGVDVIYPDFAALEPFRGRIAGVFVTHAHEDHIGALPYLLKQHDVPVWAPPYALALLRARAQEHEILAHARLLEARTREKLQVGPFTVEPIRVTHSIVDATALAIETDAGLVIHTGDFKFDEAPPDGELFDEERFAELGAAGVSLLCSDSTNIDTPGVSGSERGVGEALLRLVGRATGRVVVGLFASNVHRLRMLGDVARATGRRIVPLGRGVHTHAKVAKETGYLAWPETELVSPEMASQLPREKILGIATGTQAEANAALARLARGEHALVLEPGDTVIFSSRVIPGHESEVSALVNQLLRRGFLVETRFEEPRVHVSGHAARGEQERMIALTRPRAFLPLHGTFHHLTRHAALAQDLGVPVTCVLEDGDVGTLEGDVLTKTGRWPSGRVHVGFGREVAPEVLRERASLAASGLAVVVVCLDPKGELVGAIDLVLRGVLDETAASPALADAERELKRALGELSSEQRKDEALVKETVRLSVRRALARAAGYKPEVVVTVARVAKAADRVLPPDT